MYMDTLGRTEVRNRNLDILKRVMETMEFVGLRLNKDKCKIRQSELHYLGEVVDENGVRADPEKVKAITELKDPTNVHELKRVLGIINYMVKYISLLAMLEGPLHKLL